MSFGIVLQLVKEWLCGGSRGEGREDNGCSMQVDVLSRRNQRDKYCYLIAIMGTRPNTGIYTKTGGKLCSLFNATGALAKRPFYRYKFKQ
jgi:hypothetical protein